MVLDPFRRNKVKDGVHVLIEQAIDPPQHGVTTSRAPSR